jgi:hypothetical protein
MTENDLNFMKNINSQIPEDQQTPKRSNIKKMTTPEHSIIKFLKLMSQRTSK